MLLRKLPLELRVRSVCHFALWKKKIDTSTLGEFNAKVSASVISDEKQLEKSLRGKGMVKDSMKDSVNVCTSDLFVRPGCFKVKAERSHESKTFGSDKYGYGLFDKALDNVDKDVLERARQDLTNPLGDSKVKNALVKAYLSKDSNISAFSNLFKKTVGLEYKPNDALLEVRLLSGKVSELGKELKTVKYSHSKLAKYLAHPLLNANLAKDMDEFSRADKLDELEAFYGQPICQVVAFLEFRSQIKEIQDVIDIGRQELHKLPRDAAQADIDQLAMYESNTLSQFFSDAKKEDSNTSTTTTSNMLHNPEFSKVNVDAIVSQRSSDEHRLAAADKQRRIFRAKQDHRAENQTAAERCNEYAYDRPLQYADTETVQIYNSNLTLPDTIPAQNKYFPKAFIPNIAERLKIPMSFTKSHSDMRIDELIHILKNEEKFDDEFRLDYQSYKSVMSQIYRKQELEDIRHKDREVKVLDSNGVYRRRNNNWRMQELLKHRVSKQSVSKVNIDTVKQKGAFTQLSKVKFGLNMEEQSVLGVLHFNSDNGLDLNQSRSFQRNLKRNIIEYLADVSLQNFVNRTDTFLAIEKAIENDQLPILSEAVVLALVLHPFSKDYLHILCHSKFIKQYTMTSIESLSIFNSFMHNLDEPHVYSEFYKLFYIQQYCPSVYTDLHNLWYNNNTNTNCIAMARQLLNLQIHNSTSVSADYLSCLKQLHISDDIGSISLMSDADVLHIQKTPALRLFFAELLTRSDYEQSLRLIAWASTILNDLYSNANIVPLLLTMAVCVDRTLIQQVFADHLYNTLLIMNRQTMAECLKQQVNTAMYHLHLAHTNQEHRYTTTNNDVYYKPYLNHNASIYVAYKTPLLDYCKVKYLETNVDLFNNFSQIVTQSASQTQLETYLSMLQFFTNRTANTLPIVFNKDRSLNKQILYDNTQIISDFYNLSVKPQISSEDWTANQQVKTSYLKHKASKQIGLNFSSRVSKMYFSNKKSDDEVDSSSSSLPFEDEFSENFFDSKFSTFFDDFSPEMEFDFQTDNSSFDNIQKKLNSNGNLDTANDDYRTKYWQLKKPRHNLFEQIQNNQLSKSEYTHHNTSSARNNLFDKVKNNQLTKSEFENLDSNIDDDDDNNNGETTTNSFGRINNNELTKSEFENKYGEYGEYEEYEEYEHDSNANSSTPTEFEPPTLTNLNEFTLDKINLLNTLLRDCTSTTSVLTDRSSLVKHLEVQLTEFCHTNIDTTNSNCIYAIMTQTVIEYFLIQSYQPKLLKQLLFVNDVKGILGTEQLGEVRQLNYTMHNDQLTFSHLVRGNIVQKDLNKYLFRQIFHCELSTNFWVTFCQFMMENDFKNFDRKLLKGAVVNSIMSCSTLKEEVMSLMLHMLTKKQLPFVCLEVFYLIRNCNIKMSQAVFDLFFSHLGKVKNLRYETFNTFIQFIGSMQGVPHIELALQFLHVCLKDQQPVQFDYFFNIFKIELEAKKYKFDINKSNEDNNALEQAFYTRKLHTIKRFYSELFTLTIEYNLSEQSEMIFAEMKHNTYFTNSNDILNILKLAVGNKDRFEEMLYDVLPSFIFAEQTAEQNDIYEQRYKQIKEKSGKKVSRPFMIYKEKRVLVINISHSFARSVQDFINQHHTFLKYDILKLYEYFIKDTHVMRDQDSILTILLQINQSKNFNFMMSYFYQLRKKDVKLDHSNFRLAFRILNECSFIKLKLKISLLLENLARTSFIDHELLEMGLKQDTVYKDDAVHEYLQAHYPEQIAMSMPPRGLKIKKPKHKKLKRALSIKKNMMTRFYRVTLYDNPFDEEVTYEV